MIAFLRRNYDGRTLVLAAGQWLCVMPELGIPYRKTISETNRRQWNKLPSGLDSSIGWVICRQGDRVYELMRAYPEVFRDFELAESSNFPGEGSFEVYRRRTGQR
jgi:hypothetical protein